MTGKNSASCCPPPRPLSAQHKTHSAIANLRAKERPTTVIIPGGQALIGTADPKLPIDGEGVIKRAKIKSFKMATCAVINAEFATFVQDTGYETEAERIGDSFVFVGFLDQGARANSPSLPAASWWRLVKGANWRALHGPGSDQAWRPDHPVVQVSWHDAQAYAVWAGGRLPTEMEWEHAARGDLGDTPFPWGDQEPNETDFFPCNIWQGSFPQNDTGADGFEGTAPAQSFESNAYGLYNMVGNTWEWTRQAFTPRSMNKKIQQAHADKKGFKLVKGGSFLCHASYCYRYRIAARTGNSPDSTTSHTGFRLVFDC